MVMIITMVMVVLEISTRQLANCGYPFFISLFYERVDNYNGKKSFHTIETLVSNFLRD